MTDRLVDATNKEECFRILGFGNLNAEKRARTVDGDRRGNRVPTKVYVTIGQGSERCVKYLR